MTTSAVFFDVDFTLIYPGPRFQGTGYQSCCARHGLVVDASKFEAAVAGASSVLDSADQFHDPDAYVDLYVTYTRRIIELMGGSAPAADAAARELYDEWAEHHHFSLYDDVVETLEMLRDAGVRVGLISNSHRSLESFQSHFELDDLIAVAVSSFDHGYMKPHPNIFRVALDLMSVPAEHAMMVGDSLTQDVLGARRSGMTGVLIARGGVPSDMADDVPVVRSLRELPALLGQTQSTHQG